MNGDERQHFLPKVFREIVCVTVDMTPACFVRGTKDKVVNIVLVDVTQIGYRLGDA
jgi:hypothetical protein